MRILVADDNRDAVLMLEALLGDDGHQVRGVYCGTDVLPAMRTFKPDAVVLDIKMPGLSGYEVARRIRSHYGESKPLLIAISGHYNHGVDKILAQLVGFNHALTKPCDPRALSALLAS